MVLRSLLTIFLVTTLVACTGEDASVNMPATTVDGAAASASDSSRILGTELDAETLAEIIQLDVEQNEANRIGDSEGMIDRMVADDTLWVGGTGGVVNKAQILAVVRHNFQRDPSRTKAGAAPHDDFGTRRFGDVIVHHGRSTTLTRTALRGRPEDIWSFFKSSAASGGSSAAKRFLSTTRRRQRQPRSLPSRQRRQPRRPARSCSARRSHRRSSRKSSDSLGPRIRRMEPATATT